MFQHQQFKETCDAIVSAIAETMHLQRQAELVCCHAYRGREEEQPERVRYPYHHACTKLNTPETNGLIILLNYTDYQNYIPRLLVILPCIGIAIWNAARKDETYDYDKYQNLKAKVCKAVII